jgi:uncharacterized protein involved in exopolysaccharide biosynthesis
MWPDLDRAGMSYNAGSGPFVPDWLEPQLEQGGLSRYIGILRERWKLILATAVLTTLAAAAYVATAPRTYSSSADILVTPFDVDDAVFSGLGLIGASGDPTRDVETISRLVGTSDVFRRVGQTVPAAVQAQVKGVRAEPVAQSSIVP